MEVIYHGGHPHGYHSAPSGFDYIFQPGVAQVVKPEDEEFFQHMARAPGSVWEVVGMEVAKPADAEVVEEPKSASAPRRGGKR